MVILIFSWYMEYNITTNNSIGLGNESNFKIVKCQWQIMVLCTRYNKSDEQLNIANGKSIANLIRYKTNNKYGCGYRWISSLDIGTKFRSNQMFSFQKVLECHKHVPQFEHLFPFY